ncbi:MAG: CapA family protein [Acidobacteria bacterium]|nr:CapA family protein [Acidobacteriota bacterium]
MRTLATGRPGLLVAVALCVGCTTASKAPIVQTPVGTAVADSSPHRTTAPEPFPPQEAAPPTALPGRSLRPLSIAAVGDIMMGTDYPENHLPDDDGVSFLSGVTSTLIQADITFGNLEGVLMDGGEPRKECEDSEMCYLFRSPSRYARYLREAGFDVMSLANNHSRDFGEEGRAASMAALASTGIHHSGREGDVAIWDVLGHRVALIAFATTVGSHSLLEIEPAAERVRELASVHDIVLVSFHGGAEGLEATHIPFTEEMAYGELRGHVVRFSRAMIEAGAHLVIGHGPHVPRAMELHRNRLIAYSLGNFATYYGISVGSIRGLAPILLADIDPDGNFLRGRIVSAQQIRPSGPTLDPKQAAYRLIRQLTEEDFDGGGFTFYDDGTFLPRTPGDP